MKIIYSFHIYVFSPGLFLVIECYCLFYLCDVFFFSFAPTENIQSQSILLGSLESDLYKLYLLGSSFQASGSPTGKLQETKIHRKNQIFIGLSVHLSDYLSLFLSMSICLAGWLSLSLHLYISVDAILFGLLPLVSYSSL